jgi:hypothetical protein
MFDRWTSKGHTAGQLDEQIADLGRAGRWHEVPVERREQVQEVIQTERKRSFHRLPDEPWIIRELRVGRQTVEAIRMAAAFFLVGADNAEQELLDSGPAISDQKRTSLDWASVDSRVLANDLIALADEMAGYVAPGATDSRRDASAEAIT